MDFSLPDHVEVVPSQKRGQGLPRERMVVDDRYPKATFGRRY